ncbi:polyadenylate-binding protein 2-B [Hydra vulgaris]|uniref:Polyadenylate-binding protein 2-B-like n=1 Tax=Hydra vulgaris TaxID=6087 RepID=A0ABM4DPV4_HYDVU|nr:polyadenylate-binding protein 2-B [Hydra vulgaris]
MSNDVYTGEFESSNWSSLHKESDETLIDDGSLNEEADDPEIEAIKARVKEMEEEAEKLKEMQKEAESSLMSPQHAVPSSLPGEDQASIDCRSVYVGNVDYSATASELEQHFHGCGSVNRVTILCDKFSGHPKGFAYVEFGDKDSVENAVQLSDSLFKGRQIKVTAKRTNVPGISTTNRGFRGGQGRGRGRGGFRGGYMGGFAGGFTPRGRGAYRSRRAQWFSPY